MVRYLARRGLAAGRVAIVLVGVALGFGAGPVWAQGAAEPVVEDQVLAVFLGAAFGQPANRAGARLYRWQAPIRMRLVGQAPQRFRIWAADQAKLLARLSGLEISQVDDIDANFLVYFVPSFDDVISGAYNDLLKRYIEDPKAIAAMLEGYRRSGAICSGQVSARDGVLDEAIVFVPIDRLPPVVHGCIASQMTRVLGLPFAVAPGLPSALAMESPYSFLTRVDAFAVQLLYDQRMTVGMSVEAAAEAARRALPALEARQ